MMERHKKTNHDQSQVMPKRLIQTNRARNLDRILSDIGPGSAHDLAERMDVNPSYISNLRRGRKTIGDQIAERIESSLGLPSNTLDREPPDLEQENPGPERWITVEPMNSSDLEKAGSAQGIAPSTPPGAVLSRESLERQGVLGHRLTCFLADGVSMEPTICDGDIVIVDHDDTAIVDGGIYVIDWNDEIRVKRLFWKADGAISVESDHPSKTRFPNRTVHVDQPGFAVIARVRVRGGWID